MASVFDAMKKNTRLKRHAEKAKAKAPDERVSNNDFPGPDGEYIFIYTGYRSGETNKGIGWAQFQYRVAEVDGQEEYAGAKTITFCYFNDSEYQTVEEVQETFFAEIQLLGVTTKGRPDDEIEQELKELANQLVVKGSVKTGKKKAGKKPNKYFNLIGVAENQEVEESIGEVDETPEEEVEIEEAEEAIETVSEEPDWESVLGAAVWYGDEQFWIHTEDYEMGDEGPTVTLVDENNEIIHSYVPLTELTPVEE